MSHGEEELALLERKVIRPAVEAGHAQRECSPSPFLLFHPLATALAAELDLCKTVKRKKFGSAHLLLLHCVPPHLLSDLSFCFLSLFVSPLNTNAGAHVHAVRKMPAIIS